MTVVDGSFDHPLALEEHATLPLAGGVEQMGFQCGQVWGAALAAGARAYQLFGPGPEAEAAAIIAAQRLADSFCTRYKSINCLDVIDLDWKNAQAKQVLKFLLRGGPVRCFSSTAGYARAAFSEINATFAGNQLAAPAAPVSCAALLAQKMGASDLHAVMAGGLAGGIGLSGGACGALGAAIWLSGVMNSEETDGKISFNGPAASAVTEKFLESSDYEFECAKIVGRKFENAADHAAYVSAGGCAKIIEALAACLPTDRASDPIESGASA